MEKKNEQEQEHLRHFLHTERTTRKFLDVSRCSRAKQRQRHLQNSVLHLCFFFLVFATDCFGGCRCRCRLDFARFYILFE